MNTSEVDRLLVSVTQLNQTTKEVMDVLAAQQNILRMRKIELDPELLAQTVQLHQRVHQIFNQLMGQQPELIQLRALVRTMSVFSSTLDLRQVLNDVMDNFIALTESERGLIVLIDPDTGELDFSVIRGMDEKSINKTSFLVSKTVVQETARTGKPVMTNNALEDPRFKAQESVISYAARSILCVPMTINQRVIGVCYADHRLRGELFGNQEIQFLAGYANQAAIAIENARLYEDVQQRLGEITQIRTFLDNIFSSIASGVVTLDTNGVVITANRAAEQMLGITAAESLGQPYQEVFPMLYEGFDDFLQSVLGQRLQQSLEINPVLPVRGPVHLTLKLSPLVDSAQNRVQGVVIVIDDLTEIKKHDETLRVVNTYLSPEMVTNIRSIDRLGLGGDTRPISAIFADVRGFTTFSEKLQPEELMAVINEYLSVSSSAIQQHQGIIDKFMGDAVLGLFNTQLNPSTDFALQAVLSAMTIIENVKALHQQLPANKQLLYGIGIHTGMATIGNIGSPSRKEFSAIGDAIDLAKKLQECAQGGEIILSAETYEQVKDKVQCERVERQLRGQTDFKYMYLVRGLAR
jgi:PAS domain S-box-containing protein